MARKVSNKWDGCSLDRSFCSETCSNMECYRNSKYITDNYPHSFCDFKGTEDCEGFIEVGTKVTKSKKKKVEPNYKRLLDSAIFAYQTDYIDYKKAYNKMLSMTFITGDGEFGIMSGYEEVQREIERLSISISNDVIKIKELKEKIKVIESEEV